MLNLQKIIATARVEELDALYRQLRCLEQDFVNLGFPIGKISQACDRLERAINDFYDIIEEDSDNG